jgi:hypothetical protein
MADVDKSASVHGSATTTRALYLGNTIYHMHGTPTAQWSRKSFGQLAAGKPDRTPGLLQQPDRGKQPLGS